MILTIQSLIRDEGSVVLFQSAEGPVVAVDHRCAQAIADALQAGEQPVAQCEAWQIIGPANLTV